MLQIVESSTAVTPWRSPLSIAAYLWGAGYGAYSELITPVPHQSHILRVNAEYAQKEQVIASILSAPGLPGTTPEAKKSYKTHFNESLSF